MKEMMSRAPIEFFRGGRFDAPFSRAVRVGDILHMSGEIGVRPDGSFPLGLAAQTRQAMENIGATLADFGLGMDAIFKVTVMLVDMDEWALFNAAYLEYFDGTRLPARSAFGASKLVANCLVELECLAYFPE